MSKVSAPQLPEDSRQVVRGFNEDGTAIFEQIGIEEISFKGRFGALANSSSSATVAVGNFYFRLDVDDGSFKVGDDVLIVCKDDADAFMWGEVIDRDTVEEPVRLRINVDDVSDNTITSSNWELQVVARPKPGVEKDTSSTSVAFAAIGSTMAFDVQSSKFFPIGGKILLKALASQTAVAIGKVLAYTGTSLVVLIVAKTAAASGTFTSWSIALLDAPQDKIQRYHVSGLRISINASDPTHDIDIAPGSVRDSTDSLDLVLSTSLTKRLDAVWAAGTNQGSQVQSANLAGTISSLGTTVTGTGTAFRTDFFQSGGGQALNTELNNQYSLLAESAFTENSVISAGGVNSTTESSASNTSMTTNAALGVGGGTSYKRGGWTTDDVHYVILLIRKDSDGSIDVATSALTGSGTPDLPSGYTYYSVIGKVKSTGGGLGIDQPLRRLSGFRAEEIKYTAGSRTYALGDDVDEAIGNLDSSISSVNFALDARLDTLEAGTAPAATASAAGFVELATNAEAAAGSDTTRAVVPANLGALAGTYSPATAANVNLDANPTVGTFDWLRIGTTVIVSGNMAMNPTTGAGTATSCNISLPVARGSNFASTGQAHGVVTCDGTTAGVGHVESVSGGTSVKVVFAAQNTANHQVYIVFTYQV